MNLRRKVLSAAAATVIAAGGLSLAGAVPAFAINRALPCNSEDTGHFLEFYSGASTCWANAGSVDVGLYDVVNAYSGNNTGEFFSPNLGWVGFSKWALMPPNANWNNIEVTFIDIF